MKITIKIVAFLLIVCISRVFLPVYASDYTWYAASPDENITLSVTLENGNVLYEVKKGYEIVIHKSPLGIILEDTDFSGNLSFSGSKRNAIDEVYSMISGKANQYKNKANEMVLTFTNSAGKKADIYFRVYNDGIAFRYGLDAGGAVIEESSGFILNPDSVVWAMDYHFCYEDFYNKKYFNQLNGDYAMPFLAKVNSETYVLISEADLNGRYAGSMLKKQDGGLLKVCFEPKQSGSVLISKPFLSPWRTAVIGDSSIIAETQMIENLSPPSIIGDTSWINPGVTGWTWFNGDTTNDPEVYKRYIDLSAEMGWAYVLLDEGWQPKYFDQNGERYYEGTFPWVYDVLEYAKAKNIGILVWSTWWDLDTPVKRERLAEWAEMGIKGVKVDFFDAENQSILTATDEIIEEATKNKLLINLHGCNKPTGESRTYPNILTKEGVYGAEHFASGEGWGATAEHNCTLPFTRNAIGPMDYTPAITNYYDKNFYSYAHKAALAVVFESGIQCFSDKPNNYRNSVLYPFLANFPAEWDETRLLSGAPGEYAVMARRKGDNYYIGSITNEAREINISLDFLANGTYTAEIYKDGSTDTEINTETRIVTSRDILIVSQLTHGGCAMKLTKVSSGAEQVINTQIIDIRGHWSESAITELMKDGKLNNYFYGTFLPDSPITRGEFVAMLITAMNLKTESTGKRTFDDVVNYWAKNYVHTATELGIVNGTSENTFSPNDLITREQIAAIIGRRIGTTDSASYSVFNDSKDISEYAVEFVNACSNLGIVKGYEDNTFRPQNNITRAESAVIIGRALKTM